MVNANLLACHAPGVGGKYFNVAANQQITLNRACEQLRSLTGYKGPVVYLDERAGEIRHSFAEIKAAQAELGYKPAVDFQKGLQLTVSWYRNKHGLQNEVTTTLGSGSSR